MQSPLMATFPLSPRKFWKKFLQANFFRFIIGLIFFVPGIVLFFETTSVQGMQLVSGVVVGIDAFILVIVGLSAWYISAYIRSYYYADDEGFLTIRKGVFTPTEIHVQYGRIQDVYVDQDLFDRVFGIYDVHIATATQTSGIEAHIDGVDTATAEGLKNFLLGRIKNMGSANQPIASMPAQMQMPAAMPVPVPGTVPAGSASVQASAVSMNAAPMNAALSSDAFPLGQRWFVSQIIRSLGALVFVAVAGVIVTAFNTVGRNSFVAPSQGPYIAVAVIALAIIILGSISAWRKNYYFAFANDFVVFRTGIITTQERHIPYAKIQDVTVSQDIVDAMLGLWTVTVENAAQQMYGRRGAPINSNVSLVGLTKDQADYLAGQVRVIMNRVGGGVQL